LGQFGSASVLVVHEHEVWYTGYNRAKRDCG